MNCETCHLVYHLPACPVELLVKPGLDADTEYTVKIVSALGNSYSQTVTTDAYGVFALDLETLPEALFTEHSGLFVMTITKDGVAQELTFDSETYPCVQFSFSPAYGDASAVIE